MTDSPVTRTVQSYDHIVADYLARWRDRSVMASMIDRFVDLLPTSHQARPLVADVGCGPGFDGAVLRDRGLSVVGLDLSWGMLQAGRQHYPGKFVQADMRHLPMASVFDGLWVNASLLHLPRQDAKTALEGFARILRPGGCLFLSIKEGRGEQWQVQTYGHNEPRFFTYWNPDEIDALLHGAGLTIVSGSGEQENGPNSWLIRYARK
jgi:SAM-dependent methyltransferase